MQGWGPTLLAEQTRRDKGSLSNVGDGNNRLLCWSSMFLPSNKTKKKGNHAHTGSRVVPQRWMLPHRAGRYH